MTDVWPEADRSKLLAVNDLITLDPTRRISRIDYELRLLDDLLVVVIGVIGDDKHAIVLAKIVERGALHLQIVFASAPDEREIGVVVADRSPFFLQQFDDGERRRFAQIVDIF